jgi:hypothetical protein
VNNGISALDNGFCIHFCEHPLRNKTFYRTSVGYVWRFSKEIPPLFSFAVPGDKVTYLMFFENKIYSRKHYVWHTKEQSEKFWNGAYTRIIIKETYTLAFSDGETAPLLELLFPRKDVSL